MVDSTRLTRTSGQYVHHALVESDEMVNLRQSLEVFKDNNPGWKNVRVVMTAKAVHEKDVLRDMLPHARQLLCQLHVITVARYAGPVKKDAKALVCLLPFFKPSLTTGIPIKTSVADLELASLPLQISKFAFNLVSGQHELATGPNANHDVDLDNPGKAAMTAPTTGNVYRVGTLMTEDVDLLAFWPGYGYATFDQLVGMNRIQEARHRQTLVMRTVKWIDEVEWRIQDLRKPFEDSPSCRQVGIQKLRRGNQPWNEPRAGRHARRASAVRFQREFVAAHHLDSSVTVGTQRRIPGLGVISPSFHDVCLLEQKRRTAGGLGAGNPEYARVIGAMNVGAHWVVFFINRNNKVCKTFDPLQSNVNYKTVEKRVRSVMEPILDLKDQVHFERIEWCTQQD
ncbi:hypothetical protein GQ600_18917 [Phytophthora cactorum]|nr:hypothetical protein GQ600_18917 [Phytophthora cactorum]